MKNLALQALSERTKGPYDCGGPLDGWNLSPYDVVLFLARHHAIQKVAQVVGSDPNFSSKKVVLR